MDLNEIRSRYLEFFKKRGHVILPSASLVPQNDPTTLFTGSGMQPLVPYLLGKNHPAGSRLADSQKCFRAMDIEEVGDNRHTTFFEMLGNWSLGDYFKEEQLSWLFEFLTDEKKGIGLNPERLYVTVFAGDERSNIARDKEAAVTWKKLFLEKGLKAKEVELLTEERGGQLGMQGGRIFYYDAKKNWWSRSGIPEKMPPGEPGGPDSEVFYEFTDVEHDKSFGENCHPNCDCGHFLEIGNSVFMQFLKQEDGSFASLPKQNVDFGGGLERLAAASCNNPDVFSTDIFEEAKNIIAELSGVNYANPQDIVVAGMSKQHGMPARVMRHAYRVMLDHMRAATFLIADGVSPGKEDREYLVRRLIRRAVRYADKLNFPHGKLTRLSDAFIEEYKNSYPALGAHGVQIHDAVAKEELDFRRVLEAEGPKLNGEIQEAVLHAIGRTHAGLSAEVAFQFVTAHGLPFDMIVEEAADKGVEVDTEGFYRLMSQHREISRAGIQQKFKGGLADTAENTVRLHTAHHLLLRALQLVLGGGVHQRGSNITQERLRIDFSYAQKMTGEQIAEVEHIVNEKIAEDLPVIRSEMNKEEAERLGAEHEFGAKYPERVSVYSIGPKDAAPEDPKFAESFSIEFCGGPHVTHTGALGDDGKYFKIQKEEAVSQGVRRIKAILAK